MQRPHPPATIGHDVRSPDKSDPERLVLPIHLCNSSSDPHIFNQMSRRGKEPPVRHTPLNTVYYHRSLTPQDVNGETPPVSIHPSTINIDYEDQGDDHAKELLDDPVFYKLPKYKEKKPYDTWGSWAANLGTADRAKPTKKVTLNDRVTFCPFAVFQSKSPT